MKLFFKSKSGINIAQTHIRTWLSLKIPLISIIILEIKLLLLKNCEVHLHPKIEADLPNCIGASIKKIYQFLIETHSEENFYNS